MKCKIWGEFNICFNVFKIFFYINPVFIYLSFKCFTLELFLN